MNQNTSQYKNYYIKRSALCSVGKKGHRFPDHVECDDYLAENIQPELDKIDKRIDARTLAERLIKYCREKPTGVYGYEYYL